jgi:hypothetical protein
VAVCVNFKDGGIFEYDRRSPFYGKGWSGGKIMDSKLKDCRFEYYLPDYSFFLRMGKR